LPPLDHVLPDCDVRERHQRWVAAAPKDAVAAALGVPLAGEVRALIRRRWLAATDRAVR
jgi:hypothetical protein